jgi:hypothetical protein
LLQLHPSQEWRQSALDSHLEMIQYMEGLNTNLG